MMVHFSNFGLFFCVVENKRMPKLCRVVMAEADSKQLYISNILYPKQIIQFGKALLNALTL